jgi:hypothetical protein
MAEQKLTKDPFEALNKLAELSKETEEVTIADNFKILLSTVGAEDEAEIFAAAAEKKATTDYFSKTKRETLVRAVIAINGLSLREYDKLEKLEEYSKIREETLSKVRKIVDTWDDNLVTFIYGKWSAIVKKNEDKLVKMKILEPVVEEKKEEEKKEEKK